MNYLTFKGKDTLLFTYNGKDYTVCTQEDWQAAVEDIQSAPDYEPASFMCSSSIDFPEEYTEDEFLIDLCYQIRNN